MKIKRCVVSCLAAISTALFSAVFAAAAGVIPQEPMSDEQLVTTIQSDSRYTAEQKKAMIAKVNRSETGPMPRSFPSRTLSNYPTERQQGNYWCVPATTRMVIRYKVSSAASQAQIAQALGVDNNAGVPLADAVPYLNRNAATDYIWQGRPSSLSRYQTNINDTLSTKKPVLLSTTFTTEMGYPYPESYYHAIAIIGQTANATRYTIRDPNNKGKSTNYTIPANGAYSALDHYIW